MTLVNSGATSPRSRGLGASDTRRLRRRVRAARAGISRRPGRRRRRGGHRGRRGQPRDVVAHEAGVRVLRVLARVNHPKNEWLFDEQWGVDASVSPLHILTAMVEEADGRRPRPILRLEGATSARRDAPPGAGSPNAGRALYELRLPPIRPWSRSCARDTRRSPSRRLHCGRRRDRRARARRVRGGALRRGGGVAWGPGPRKAPATPRDRRPGRSRTASWRIRAGD